MPVNPMIVQKIKQTMTKMDLILFNVYSPPLIELVFHIKLLRSCMPAK